MSGQPMGGQPCPFPWGGPPLELLAERAVWLPQRRWLVLADLHLGKAETFQAHGIPLPSDGDADTLNALLRLAHCLRPAAVLVLGDLIHSRLGLTAELRQKLAALPELLGCPLRLIGGNHDQGSWIAGLAQEPSQAHDGLWFSHEPDPQPGLLNVCGHVHPVAVIGGGADRLRLPCFAHHPGRNTLVMPAFGRLTGGHPCGADEILWLVAEGTIVPWTPPVSRRRPGLAPHRRG